MISAPTPTELGGAKVVAYAILENIRHSGATVHSTPDGVLPPPRALAICQQQGDKGWYLFHCDGHWNVLADTFHLSEAEAKDQAEFEFNGVGKLWRHAV